MGKDSTALSDTWLMDTVALLDYVKSIVSKRVLGCLEQFCQVSMTHLPGNVRRRHDFFN